MNEWRVIRDHPRPGAEGLAFDEAILQNISSGHAPNTLKIYYFAPPTAVLGRHQTIADVNLSYLQDKGLALNRRLTGGGVILLGLPGVYSQMGVTLVVRNNADLPANLRGKLEYFTRIIAGACKDIGLKPEIGPNFDIVVGTKKIAGCGIYSEEGATLFHAMILLDCDYAATARVLQMQRIPPFGVILQAMREKVTTVLQELGQDISVREFEAILINQLPLLTREPAEEGNYLESEIIDCQTLLDGKYTSQDWILGTSGNTASIGACFVPAPSEPAKKKCI